MQLPLKQRYMNVHISQGDQVPFCYPSVNGHIVMFTLLLLCSHMHVRKSLYELLASMRLWARRGELPVYTQNIHCFPEFLLQRFGPILWDIS